MIKKESLKIKGMSCASCAQNIVVALKKLNGIKWADVNFATKKAIFEYDEGVVELEEIKNTIVKTGYEIDNEDMHVEKHQHEHNQIKSEKLFLYKVIGAIVFTLPIFFRMFWMWEVPGNFFGASLTNWIQHDLSFVVVFIFGWQFHSNALRSLKRGRAEMDTLISIGTLSAYFYSLWAMFNGGHLYFESAATIASLILLGRFLELKTKNRASKAMEKLMELGVKKARALRMGKEVELNIEDIVVGDYLIVKAGEKMPLDGLIIEGETSVDESMLTGESMPIGKNVNDEVYGATMNLSGAIKIKVTKEQTDTMLAQIIKTVEEAQTYKAPMQKLADKIAGIFVPVVIGISFFTFLGWYFATGNIAMSLINAVSVLIISCPCALGIATPIAIMIGTSVGASNGILIKNGESFEKAKNIDTIVFDKTGTLTEGKPVVQEVLINGAEESQILKVGASLAKYSGHPISRAVFNRAEEDKVDLAEMINNKEFSGLGVGATCKNHGVNLFLGNIKLLKENKINTDWAEDVLGKNKNSAGTIIFVAHGEKVIGGFIVADKIKESTKKAISLATSAGLESIMISGDNKATAKAVSEKVGIIKYLAEVMPTEKQREVKKLQQAGKRVVFVGDGINDAPSLVQADLGIAMGSGSDIAKESGDIIIVKNNLLKVIEALNLSKKTFNIIKQNLFWAFFYNVLAIPLAVMGLVNPMVGAIAMSLSDVTIIGNSLRIYKK